MYLWLSPMQRVKEAQTFTSTTNVVPKTTHFTYWCPLSTPINIPNSRGNSHFTGITYSFMMSMTNWAWYVVFVAFFISSSHIKLMPLLFRLYTMNLCLFTIKWRPNLLVLKITTFVYLFKIQNSPQWSKFMFLQGPIINDLIWK